MDYIFINSYMEVAGTNVLSTTKCPIIESTDSHLKVAYNNRFIKVSTSRLDDGTMYKTPVTGFYFSNEHLARAHVARKNYEREYQLAGRLISDLRPYVVDVAMNEIAPGTHEEEYHLWGKTVKATLDELVRIFDHLSSRGFPPEGVTRSQLALWMDILGYTKKDYPTICTQPIELFISDVQMLDEIAGSKEGLTTEQYEEHRRYIFRQIVEDYKLKYHL